MKRTGFEVNKQSLAIARSVGIECMHASVCGELIVSVSYTMPVPVGTDNSVLTKSLYQTLVVFCTHAQSSNQYWRASLGTSLIGVGTISVQRR